MDTDDIFLDNGFDHNNLPPPAASDKVAIIRIALTLVQKLPADLVSIILDYARLWALLDVSETERSLYKSVDENTAGYVVHYYDVPAHFPAGSIRQLKFVVASKDQGWSDYSIFHDSYEGSWSWLEGGVRRNCTDEKLRSLERSGRSGYFAGAAEDDVARLKIVTNLHAVSRWTVHKVIWDATNKNMKVCDLIDGLKGGDRIEVSMWAQYPGWQNFVSFVRIEINGVYIRKM